MGYATTRPPRRPHLPALRRGRSRRSSEPSAARTLATAAACVGLVGATVAWSAPAAHWVRDAACGTGPGSCAPPLYQVSDPGRCRVISRANGVTEDAVVFSDDVRGTQGLRLSRRVDRDAVVTWTVEQDGDQSGLVELRSFAERRSADRYTLAVTRAEGRSLVQRADGTGLAGRLTDRIDAPGLDGAPAPSALVVTGTGGGSDRSPELTPPSLPGPGPGSDPLLVTWYAAPQRPDQLHRLRTVWELDWSSAQELTLAAPGGSGRFLLALTQSRDGVPLYLELEVAGDLAARLAPPTSGEAFADPLSRRPGDPSVPAGAHAGRLVISVNLAVAGTRELGAALTELVGASLFPAPTTAAAPDDPRSVATQAGRSRREAQFSSLVGALLAVDRGMAGTSATLHEMRVPPGRPTQVIVTRAGRLTFDGALPAADYYLARSAGFVKWQECTQ